MSETASTIRVLHVDDEPDFADVAATFLEREDDRFDVETTTSAGDGLDYLASDDFDCVVSDFDMPGQNGIEFLKTVRQDNPDLPFILYTGKGSEEVAADAISAGVSDYLQKESGTEQYTVLANRIINLVSKSRAETRIEQYAEAQEESERYRQQLLEIMSDLSRSEDEKINHLLALGCERLGVENGHLVMIDDVAGKHDVISVHGSDVVREGVTDLATTYCRKTIESDDIIDVYHAGDQGWDGDAAYEAFKLECYIGGKITVDDTLFGTLCFVDSEPREPFTHNEKAFFNLLLQWCTQMVERRRRLNQAEAIFDHAQDAIFLIDVNDEETFRIRSVNHAYEEMTGLSTTELRGQTPRELLGDEQGREVESRFKECVTKREPIEYEEQLTLDGQTFDFQTRLAPIIEEDTVVQLVGATRDITERKKREQRYDAIFNQTYQFTGLLETDGTLIEANETALEFGGLDRESVIGKKMWKAEWFQHSEETEERARQAVKRAAGGEFVRHELPVQGADREAIIDFSVRPITDDEGNVTLLVPEGRDITERKEREEKLELVETLFEHAEECQFIVDVADGEFKLRHANEYYKRTVGLSPAEPVTGQTPTELFGETGGQEILDRYRECVETRESVTYTVEVPVPEQGTMYRTILTPVVTDDEVTHVVGTARDITDYKRRERELQRYEELIETLPIGYVRTSFDDEFLNMNLTFVDMLGGDSEEEIRSHDVSEFYRDPATRERLMKTLRDKGEVASKEVKATTMSGDTIWVTITGRVVDAEDGRYIDALVQDITERNRHAEQLRALNERSQMLISADTSEQIAEIGVEAARKTLGLDASSIHLHDTEQSSLVPEAATDTLYDLIGDPPVFTSGESIAWRAYEEGEALALDDVREDPDALNPETPMRSELYFPLGDHGILVAGSPTPNAFDEQDVTLGKILAANIASALDQVRQTERLRAREAELTRQNDRLEEFTSIVSHDIRNPLSVADGRLELAREECDSEHLEHVDRALDRMEALIEDLLTLAREGETITGLESVNLKAIAEDCWPNVETAEATLVTTVDRTICADESRLKQVFENLLRNAVEHGGEDVIITIGELDDGFYLEDDGPGIPEDERDDVFDVGHSTNDEGTGFGLSIAKQVVEAHDWAIEVTEGPEGGARFEITGVEFVG